MKKIQYWALRIFFVCMFVCATLFLIMIWNTPDEFNVLNQSVFTFFVVGFASFLVWFVTVVLEIKNKLIG